MESAACVKSCVRTVPAPSKRLFCKSGPAGDGSFQTRGMPASFEESLQLPIREEPQGGPNVNLRFECECRRFPSWHIDDGIPLGRPVVFLTSGLMCADSAQPTGTRAFGDSGSRRWCHGLRPRGGFGSFRFQAHLKAELFPAVREPADAALETAAATTGHVQGGATTGPSTLPWQRSPQRQPRCEDARAAGRTKATTRCTSCRKRFSVPTPETFRSVLCYSTPGSLGGRQRPYRFNDRDELDDKPIYLNAFRNGASVAISIERACCQAGGLTSDAYSVRYCPFLLLSYLEILPTGGGIPGPVRAERRPRPTGRTISFPRTAVVVALEVRTICSVTCSASASGVRMST